MNGKISRLLRKESRKNLERLGYPPELFGRMYKLGKRLWKASPKPKQLHKKGIA